MKYEPKIEVEEDRTCSVRTPSMHGVGLCSETIRNLSPEQATGLKHALETAYSFGHWQALREARERLDEMLAAAKE